MPRSRTKIKSDLRKYTLSSFSGLNNHDKSTEIDNDQAQDLSNVILTRDFIEKRGGYTELNSTAIPGSTGIYGLFPYYYNNGAQRKLLFISHTTCQQMDTGTGALTSITTGLTTNLRTYGLTFKDLFIFVNGTDNPQKIDESTPNDLGGSPPVTKYLALHKNYLFLAGNSTYPSRLYYSNLDDPETWGANDFFDVNPDDGSVITGLKVILDALIVQKEYYTYLLYGDTPTFTEGLTLWRIKQASTSTGAVNQGSMAIYGKNVLYLSRDEGIQVFGGGVTSDEVEFDSMTSTLLSKNVTPTIDGLNESRYEQAEAIVWDYKYILSVPNGSSTVNNLQLVYDFRKGGWTLWNLPANNFTRFRSSGVDFLFFGDPALGKIYRYTPTTYSDNGTAISAYYQTKDFDLKQRANNKIFRKFYVTLDKSADYTVTLTPEFDFGDTTPAEATYSIGSVMSDSLWGTMTWGTDKWGAATTSSSPKNIMNDRAKFVNYKFSNSTLSENIGVLDITQFYRLRGAR